jgi:MFS family permease
LPDSPESRPGSAPDEGNTPREPPGRAGARPRALVVDVTPLRLDRDYRWWWGGQLITAFGNQATRIAVRYQIYVLTGSVLAVGGLTLVQFIAIVLFALAGGSLADAIDRRRLLMVVHVGMGITSLSLALISFSSDPPIWAILILAFVGSGLGSVDLATRGSAIPRLVPRSRLPSAIALNQLNGRMGAIIGPAIAGLLIAGVGVQGAYLFDVLTFIASLTALVMIAPIPPLLRAPAPGLTAIRQGIGFVTRRPIIRTVLLADFSGSLFGMPTSLFPALALDVFRVGPVGFGLLGAAPAVGALGSAFLSGWTTTIERQGRAMLISIAIWGIAITAFGLLTFSFPLAWVALAIAGGADVIASVLRSTIVQFATPERLRGRVTSINSLTATSGSRLGDIEAALVAAAIGTQLSVISGGIACIIAAAAIVRATPELVEYRIRPESKVALTVPSPDSLTEPDG